MIIIGDCTEKLKEFPDKSVDIVVTSPPYNINKNSWYFDAMPEDEYQQWQKQIIRELLRITKGSIFYNHKIRHTKDGIIHPMQWLQDFPIWDEIIWYRKGGLSGVNEGRCYSRDERIYQIGKPHRVNSMNYSSIWHMPAARKAFSFPEMLVERCILMASDECDVVLDPFMGRGTTGIAAIRLNRSFVGIDKYTSDVIASLQ